jgi:hypothetical protein
MAGVALCFVKKCRPAFLTPICNYLLSKQSTVRIIDFQIFILIIKFFHQAITLTLKSSSSFSIYDTLHCNGTITDHPYLQAFKTNIPVLISPPSLNAPPAFFRYDLSQ